MTAQTTPTDSIVDRFSETFDNVQQLASTFHENQIVGTGYDAEDGTVLLVTEDTTHVGVLDIDTYQPAQYVETRTIGETDTARCYGFRANAGASRIQWVNVAYVRALANDVFDVEYRTIRSWAHVTTEESSMVEGDAPVLFRAPDHEYDAVVCPVFGPDE